MTPKEFQLLANDSRDVANVLMTLKWWARGVLDGASNPSQIESAEHALRIATQGEGSASLIADQLEKVAGHMAQAKGEKAKEEAK